MFGILKNHAMIRTQDFLPKDQSKAILISLKYLFAILKFSMTRIPLFGVGV